MLLITVPFLASLSQLPALGRPGNRQVKASTRRSYLRWVLRAEQCLFRWMMWGRQAAQLNWRPRGQKHLVDLKKVRGHTGKVMPAGQDLQNFQPRPRVWPVPSRPSPVLSGSIGWEGLGASTCSLAPVTAQSDPHPTLLSPQVHFSYRILFSCLGAACLCFSWR